jgi:glucose-1-phosphate thymidylyltransferase
MLAHVLDRVMNLEPERLVFITGYLGSQIQDWVEETYDISALFIEQPEMKGQTDAIIRVRDYVREDALILFPDMLFEADFSDINETDADVIMYTKEVEDPSALGIAVVENGRIVKLVEKPKDLISRLAVIGIYYIRNMSDLYDAIDEQMRLDLSLKNEYFIADAIQLMIDDGKRVVSSPVTEWRDCGNDQALLDTNRYLLESTGSATAAEQSLIIQPSSIDPTATIERSVVGPYASVGPRAVIRDSLVSDSIVDEDAVIDGARLNHSIVGRGAQVTSRSLELNVSDLSRVVVS